MLGKLKEVGKRNPSWVFDYAIDEYRVVFSCEMENFSDLILDALNLMGCREANWPTHDFDHTHLSQ
jgi:hypothetical protein